MAKIKYTKLDRLKSTSLEHAKLTGDWGEFRMLINNLTPGFKKALVAAGRKNAKFLIKEIRKGIKMQSPGGEKFTPLHSLTVEEKSKLSGVGSVKSNQALIRYGDLYNALAYEIDDDGSFAVGFPKNAVNSSGENINMIATVMESGITISVTDSMRNYFAFQGRPLKNSTTHIEVPARPFLEPVLQQHKDTILNNYRVAIQRILYGKADLSILENIVGDDDE